jgi:hypothetical protein
MCGMSHEHWEAYSVHATRKSAESAIENAPRDIKSRFEFEIEGPFEVLDEE